MKFIYLFMKNSKKYSSHQDLHEPTFSSVYFILSIYFSFADEQVFVVR